MPTVTLGAQPEPPVPSERPWDLRPGSEGRTDVVRTVSCTHRRDMRPLLQRRSPRPEPGPEHARIVQAAEVIDRPAAMLPPVAASSRVCCCSAAPAFQIVLPAGADRIPATEILFCGITTRNIASAFAREVQRSMSAPAGQSISPSDFTVPAERTRS